jgi:hypothetical protein
MKKMISVFVVAALTVCLGCQSVNVTKTAKGYYDPTKADDVEIVMTVPSKPFTEIATVSTRGWTTDSEAKMHNALRAKCAPLGANAVILRDSGVDYNGYYWANGVAIRFN